MRDYDETEPPKPESERIAAAIALIDYLTERVKTLERRIANLETRRTPQDNNMDDPEWY